MEADGAYPKAGIRLFVGDSPFIPFSPLLLEDMLHLPFCVLHNRSLHSDVVRRNNRGSAEGVFARANLVYL